MSPDSTCIVRACDEPTHVKKYRMCKKHYYRFVYFRDSDAYRPEPWLREQIAERDRSAGCWEWPFSRQNGYAVLPFEGVRNMRGTHAVMELIGTPVPKGMIVRHHCDNPPCMNPEHLVIGNKYQNSVDCISRNRHPHQKLVAEEVQEICRELDSGTSARFLATRYGVHADTIYAIKTGKNWNWLTGRREHLGVL